MDAAKSVKAIDGRCTPTLGAAMERTNPERSAGPDAGVRFLLLTFLCANKEK